MRPKLPFAYGLFNCAVLGLMGREPDQRWRGGYNGHYQWRYMADETLTEKQLRDHAETIAQWLDNFDIRFSGSRCYYGVHEGHSEAGEFLLIEVKFDVDEKGTPL